ncbi:hypothetical protein C3K47_09220 [Solitalea longa]|uniref:3-oxoacyl-ACP synthase n=1 Tax=Solitalea longa TaxID=2079460 RepID=A0A2S5A1U7_9SPHI|nr:hypothetical protein [Solitalea longa]POY36546.1 hypothetical protein C3K47_09220 [Solitalea longa]
MTAEHYIKESCLITAAGIFKNDELIFDNEGLQPSEFLLAAYKGLNLHYPKFYKMDVLSKLGWLCAEVLLQNGSLSAYQPEEIAVITANSNASLSADLNYAETISSIASPALFVYTLPSIVIGEICIRHGIKGENTFFVMDKFDADFMVEYVSGLMDGQTTNACICGWIEALGDDAKAVLYLIEKKETSREFTVTELNKD